MDPTLSKEQGLESCSSPPPPQGDILKYAIQLKFLTTNNIAEYEELVTGLRLAKDLDIWRLLITGDSQLVAKQSTKRVRQ
jgi:ribonuclease HI